MLFLIFINDLDKGLENCVLKFADNTKIFHGISGVQDCDILQRDLISLQKWSKDWQMQFNVDKCKVMHTGKHNPHLKYSMAKTELKQYMKTSFGVLISEDVKPSAHCIPRCIGTLSFPMHIHSCVLCPQSYPIM